jgi:hypothetical protein
MKYLKLYESYLLISDVQEDVNDYLTYLLDDDSYSVELTDEFNGNDVATINFKFCRYISVAHDIISWSHIKDYFIPFLYFMKNKYDFKGYHYDVENQAFLKDVQHDIVFEEYIGYGAESSWGKKSSKYTYLKIDDVIADSTKVPNRFYTIRFKIYCE